MQKSNEKSILCRQEGNEHYKKRQFLSALLKYNQSLCFAEENSENLGLAFANRSAVYFEMKLYEKCAANIERAIACNYPKENIEILRKRKEKCSELTSVKINGNHFKLSHEPHKTIPFVVGSLQLRRDTKYGRHVTTTKSLSVGDVIAIERPFCCVPIIESRFVRVPELNNCQRCNNCLRDNQLDLLPCSSCCQAMFCSNECLETATKLYHRFECPIMSKLQKSASINMALRIFFIGLSLFENSIDKLKQFAAENENSEKTVFDFDLTSLQSWNSKYFENYFASLFCLSRSTKKFSMHAYEDVLISHPLLASVFNKNREFICGFLQRQCQISDHNFHGIFSSSLSAEDVRSDFKNLQLSIGSGSLPFMSLVNHSCFPNVMRICEDGRVALIVCRRIEKGEQLFDCYKSNFLMEPKMSRQLSLFNEFGFKCDCLACAGDWPTFNSLPVKDAKLLKIAKKINDELQQTLTCRNQVAKKAQICVENLQKNAKLYPSVELCIFQKVFAALVLKLAESKVLF